jgi:hypothetical protein
LAHPGDLVGRGFKQFEALITGTGTSRTRQLLSLWPKGIEKLLMAGRRIVLGDAPEVAYPFLTRLIIPTKKLIKSAGERGYTRMCRRRARCCGLEASPRARR